jgi:hypothetical protein
LLNPLFKTLTVQVSGDSLNKKQEGIHEAKITKKISRVKVENGQGV